jgi:hypothetical protein
MRRYFDRCITPDRGHLVRSVLAAVVLFLSVSYAQEGDANRIAPGSNGNPADKKAFERRLDAVTWNPVRAELSWLVSVWDVRNGERTMVTKERYVMHPDVAVMEAGGEYRRFDAGEAKRLRVIMDVISTYAVESTVWWDYGPGAKMDGQIVPLPDEAPDKDITKDKENTKPEKDKDPKAKPAPQALPSRVMVAPRAELQPPLG